MIEKIGPYMQAREIAVERRMVTKRWAIHSGNVPDGDVGDLIAHVHWYAPWRRYVVSPVEGIVFDAECLLGIELFLRSKTIAHKSTRRVA